MKLRMDKKGLSDMVAVIVLLTLVLVLGAIIAGTLSGAPRPVMPAVTAVNLTKPYGGNPAAGDNRLIIRHEYGGVIDDAWTVPSIDPGKNKIIWHEMKMLVNGKEVKPIFISGTSNSEAVTPIPLPGDFLEMVIDVSDPLMTGADVCFDFAVGDQIEVELSNKLQSSDLVQLVWVSRDLMLVEYLVQ